MFSPFFSRLLVIATAVMVSYCNGSNFRGGGNRPAPALPEQSRKFPIPNREIGVNFKQGTAGQPMAEEFAQESLGVLDLLIVVDNSQSMQEEQANLATKLTPLLSKVASSDWQIAITTTDAYESGCYRRLIKKGDANAESSFQSAVLGAGTNGSGEERHFYKAVAGLKCPSNPWVRQGSTVAVLMVTDEDNCHKDLINGQPNYGCTGKADLDGSYLTNYLSSIRQLQTEARVYGIYWDPSQPQTACSTAPKSAEKIAAVVTQSGGMAGSICDADYSLTLGKISEDVAKVLKKELMLKTSPEQGTLKVQVNGQDWNGYAIAGQKVSFSDVPPLGSKIVVNYRVGSSGNVASGYKLDVEPLDGSLKVSVNGQAIDNAQFSYSKDSKMLVFQETPAELADIHIAYKKNEALPLEFDIGTNVTVTSIEAKVNGVHRDANYDVATGKVKLTPPAEDGTEVEITWIPKN